MARMTAELIVSLVDQATAPARAIASTVNNLERAQAANRREMDAARGQMLDAAAAGIALAMAIGEPIRAAMEFESAMADVSKVVNFETPDGFAQMRDDILDMSTVIPMAATEIAAIVASAGQAGMAGEELLAFAEMAAKVGVAFDISADRAGTALAEIKTALRLSVADTQALADAVNYLSNNMASSAPDVLDFMQSVGSSGKLYGFTAEQTAAIGSAMIAAGAQSEVAATSFRAMGRALARGESATGRQSDALQALGLDAAEVARRLQEDAVGTLEDVLARIRQLPAHLRASTLSDIFGEEARAIAPLLDNAELLGEALGMVADRASYLGSSQEEYAVRAETAANAAQLFRNQMVGLSIAIGSALLPAMVDIMEVIGPYLGAMADLAAAHPNVVLGIVAMVGGLVALRVATLAARFAFLFMKGGVIDMALAVTRSAGLVVAGSTKMGAAMVALRAKVAGAMMLSALGGAGLFAGLLGGIGTVVAAISGAATALAAGVAAITAPIWGLIAAIVAAVAAIAFMVWKYWGPISEFFGGMAEVIGEALGNAASAVTSGVAAIGEAVGGFVFDRIVDVAAMFGIDESEVAAALDAAIASINGVWQGIVDFVWSLPGTIGNWLGQLFTQYQMTEGEAEGFRNSGRMVATAIIDGISGLAGGFFGLGTSLLQSIWDGLVQKFEDLKLWFAQWPQMILDAIGTIDVGGAIVGLGGGIIDGIGGATSGAVEGVGGAIGAMGDGWNSLWDGGESQAVTIHGARAAGGSVVGGRSYLVGEEGPELYTAGGSGWIHSNADTAGMLGARRQVGSISFGNIEIHGVQNPRDIAARVIEEIELRLHEKFGAIHSDIEWAG